MKICEVLLTALLSTPHRISGCEAMLFPQKTFPLMLMKTMDQPPPGAGCRRWWADAAVLQTEAPPRCHGSVKVSRLSHYLTINTVTHGGKLPCSNWETHCTLGLGKYLSRSDGNIQQLFHAWKIILRVDINPKIGQITSTVPQWSPDLTYRGVPECSEWWHLASARKCLVS